MVTEGVDPIAWADCRLFKRVPEANAACSPVRTCWRAYAALRPPFAGTDFAAVAAAARTLASARFTTCLVAFWN